MRFCHLRQHWPVLLLLLAHVISAPAAADPPDGFDTACRQARGESGPRVVCAEIAAIDQMLVYNRFGSYNPFGMIFALTRDLVPLDPDGPPDEVDCAKDIGLAPRPTGLVAGEVRLRDCKRPRPLTLRANVGDLLFVRVHNWLAPVPEGSPDPRDFSRDVCAQRSAAGLRRTDDPGRGRVTPGISTGSASQVDHDEVSCDVDAKPQSTGGDSALDWPRTRGVNFVVEGLLPLALNGAAPHPACLGFDAVAPSGTGAVDPGGTFDCLYEVGQEGTHFLASRAAPAGGEGDGGSITHGLFGAVLAERPGTRWYRSQISPAAFDAVWAKADAPRHARTGGLAYEASLDGLPYLNLARDLSVEGATPPAGPGLQTEFGTAKAVEIIHNELNAIITCTPLSPAPQDDPARADQPLDCASDPYWAGRQYTGPAPMENSSNPTHEPRYDAFREFTVFFHDELKTFYTRNFEELARFDQLAGVRDGFAINYGASGMGTMLLANRKGIGPAAACAECLYEEFFLTSWANGDPALLEWYADDPSNVHHSYLNDPVVFRNFHAGPKETHVFHLHAHQWFAGNDPGRGGYLDSQTVAPGQGFSYNIYHGGRAAAGGKWYVGGSGNRNRTVGDSIFHCHLYPHFAQGMWALWRVHDVLEDGTRKLPDGQMEPGLSLDIRVQATVNHKRLGSVDPTTGAWWDPATASDDGRGKGTPIPALVPLPGEPLPPLPSYAEPAQKAQAAPAHSPALMRETKATPALPVPPALQNARQGSRPNATWAETRATSLWPVPGGPERLIRAQAAVSGSSVHPPAVSPPTSPSPAAPLAADRTGPAPAATAASEAPGPEGIPATAPVDAMPGYPFYIAAQPGHRPPQAPNDIALKLNNDTIEQELMSGRLGRHVVERSGRKLGVTLPKSLAEREQALAAALTEETTPEALAIRRELEAIRSQLVAKTLAMGDMTGHLEGARLRTLDPGGTALERAAMAFHYDGKLDGTKALTLRNAAGSPMAQQDGSGGYDAPRAPRPDDVAPPASGLFWVNGAPPKPGAPFADPCGSSALRDRTTWKNDPLVFGNPPYLPDPQLSGFRRYEVSAVQLDLIVNQAGWHDPQARIDVLTELSDSFKESALNKGRISPAVRDDEEPFFFRAISGECIEFRHTNELPKDLELDDFQVKTPTDTIGQHIHLVKFDVTSSDGSGNGWNYEDGTFAADELMARRCAALEGGAFLGATDDELKKWGTEIPSEAICAAAKDEANPLHRIWRLPRGGETELGGPNADLFQTTVQRWFADPILTGDGKGYPVDRTMRTVFSHDHFGPSSIQQHGFYTALLVEPPMVVPNSQSPGAICPPNVEYGLPGCATFKAAGESFKVLPGDVRMVGSRKVIYSAMQDSPLHPNTREFALSIADFALLYDPRDREEEEKEEKVKPKGKSDTKAAASQTAVERFGMARLLCEAKKSHVQESASAMKEACGSALSTDARAIWADGDVPPAWWAAGAPGDLDDHRKWRGTSTFVEEDLKNLRTHMVTWRKAAASPLGEPVSNGALAKPVAPPDRPESISVNHHDPYLVSYRNAPIPLRIGTSHANGSEDEAHCRPFGMSYRDQRPDRSAEAIDARRSEVEAALLAGLMPPCSYRYQLAGLAGDAGRALSSWGPGPVVKDGLPRDPETPIFESYQGDRVLFRLIQGAQEVQHSFNIAGIGFPRNIDQRFPQGMRDLASVELPAKSACFEAVRRTSPEEYDDWLDRKKGHEPAPGFAEAIARCDNLEGVNFAQEVGISEHFEIRGRMRADVAASEGLRPNPAAMIKTSKATDGREEGHPQMSDYLYNFGTVDALWNGAWGLLRVYSDGSARDIRTGFSSEEKMRDRLKPMPADSGSESPLPQSDPKSAVQTASLGACPLPSGPAGHGWNYSQGVIVALRVADVKKWSRGIDYGADRYDPDGLMLALLRPEDLGLNLVVKRDEEPVWTGLSRQKVLDAVATRYDRPEPFVMRVNAGDCVLLRYINTLQDSKMVDAIGDALAPRITPLNLDPIPHVTREGRRVTGTLTATTTPVTGLRPSAHLGLSIGLPSGELIRDLPLGYGLNREAMPPATLEDNVTVSKVFAFYAGRMRVVPGLLFGSSGTNSQDPLDPTKKMISELVDRVTDRLAVLLGMTGENPRGELNPQEGVPETDMPGFEVLGHAYRFEVEPSSCDAACLALLRRYAQIAANQEVDGIIHWIPYAFGPVPVRATGDVISQVPHGLFGVIDVLPRQWTLPPSVAKPAVLPEGRADLLADDAYLRHRAPIKPYPGAGALPPSDAPPPTDTPPPVIDAPWRSISHLGGFGAGLSLGEVSLEPTEAIADEGPNVEPKVELNAGPKVGAKQKVRLKEFVIFYQDGLNHHDKPETPGPLRGSRIDWHGNDEILKVLSAGAKSRDDRARHDQPTPDCRICDDSYDRGEQGVSYRSRPFASLLRPADPAGGGRLEASDDLNGVVFPPDFLAGGRATEPPYMRTPRGPEADWAPLTLSACVGEQVLIRVVHPGGRARQRAFVMNGVGYDDLFPGFGFPNSALLAPVKSVSAWIHPPTALNLASTPKDRQPVKGSYLWHDGPSFLMAGGTWGRLAFEDCPEDSGPKGAP